MATAITTSMRKKRGPKFRALEPWQIEILAEKPAPKKSRKR